MGAAEACKSTNSQLLWEQGEKNPIVVWIQNNNLIFAASLDKNQQRDRPVSKPNPNKFSNRHTQS
ncbi:hypothetical protein FACHB389_15965 [Nostoc calcicola FACHB-389]|nr:hypothetical protein FACHB389_15965 [Nostoc calcicola FACHB-389]